MTRAPPARSAASRPASSPGAGSRSGPPRVQSSRVPAPPATRATSLTDSTTREPSGSRAWCTTTSRAPATWSRIAACGSPTPGHQRERLDAAEGVRRRVRVHGRQGAVVPGVERLEHVERLGPAHLPHHDPVRPHPERVHDELPDRHLAAPLEVRRARLQPHHMAAAGAGARPHPRWSRCAPPPGSRRRARSASSSCRIPSRRSRARPRVPQRRAPAARRRRPAASRPATRSRSEKPACRKRRTVRHGPESDSGGITTFTREPSGRRASHRGDASSTLRPSGASTRSMACISSASPANETPVRRSLPARSTYTSPGPFTITSSTDGSDRSGSSGPSPVASSRTRRQSASRSTPGSEPASRSTS